MRDYEHENATTFDNIGNRAIPFFTCRFLVASKTDPRGSAIAQHWSKKGPFPTDRPVVLGLPSDCGDAVTIVITP